MPVIQFQPIGMIRTGFTKPEGMPIQAGQGGSAKGTLEIDAEYLEGLSDIQGFSHLIQLYHFHRVRAASLTVTPFLDKRPHGVFATRAPARPNAIGLSVVRLLAVHGCTLEVEGVDILDGTPLLDIKPYVPEFDVVHADCTGWFAETARRAADTVADARFSSDLGAAER